MRKLSFLAVMGFVWVSGIGRAVALDPRTGGTTLLETVDARAAALGQAGSTLTGDLAGVTFNPAVFTTIEHPQLETQFLVAPGDVRTALLAFGRGGERVGWGASVLVLDAGTVEITPSVGPSSTRNAQRDLVGTLSGGVSVTSWFRMGGTVKGLQSRLADEYTATTVAGDVGMLVDLPVRGLRLGGAVQNMGPDLTFRSTGDPLPLFYRGGLSFMFYRDGDDDFSPVKSTAWYASSRRTGSHVWMGADAVVDRWGHVTGNVGFEWEKAQMAALRLGGIIGEKSLGPTAGVGFTFNRWRFDYAIQLVDELTDRHRATVSYFWRADN